MDKPKKLSLEELKVGMVVRSDQIEDIYDIYIIMKDPQGITDEEGLYYTEGEITYIGELLTPEYREAWNRSIVGRKLPTIFHMSSSLSAGVFFDD